tara:strand:+ start:5201 stop:5608 length:408 start_codon:yes stop_codon:yes gene_type:complete
MFIYTIKSGNRGVAQPGSASGLGPEGRRFKSCRPDHYRSVKMKKAKIYKPTKTAMQSGLRNTKNWLLEFDTLNTGINPLMGWETSKDTMSEVKLEFSSKEQAISYAKRNNIDYYIIEPQKRKIIKKSYADNFLKK